MDEACADIGEDYVGDEASISVIIPVYNGARYLAEAVGSVLAQTYLPDEIIVVDDGSTDESAAVARKYTPRIRLAQQPNLGAAAARNRGVELAQGALLAFLDADDLWLPDKLERQVAALAAAPYPDMVFGQVEQFCSSDLAEETRFADVDRVMTGLHVGAMLIRTVTFKSVGLFRTDVRVGEFVDWYSRAVEAGVRGLVLPDLVMRRRLHADNLMRHTQNAAEEYLAILRDTLRRRRQ